jgi:hypothetical protein
MQVSPEMRMCFVDRASSTGRHAAASPVQSASVVPAPVRADLLK